MRNTNEQRAPVGVVPRRQVRSIQPLMSDAPVTCTVVGDVEPAPQAAPARWSPWLPSVTLVTAVAAAVEWLKLTR